MKTIKILFGVLLFLLAVIIGCGDFEKTVEVGNIFTVRFESNGGSGVADIRNVPSGAAIEEPIPPTKLNHVFAGWYTEAGLINRWIFKNDSVPSTVPSPVTSNITLYAKWAINAYTVSFDRNDGSAVHNVSAAHGSTITAPSDPINAGYTFDGWYKDAGLIDRWDFASDSVTSDTTLYAKWTGGLYTISLDITATHTFTAATEGYIAQTPLTVTVANTGNLPTGDLTVELSGQDADDFTLTGASITSIGINADETFTVAPNTGLTAGTYTATVTVSGENGITAQTFDVSFTVKPPQLP